MQDLIPHPNFLGYIGTEVAFTECHQWHKKLLVNLKNNQQIIAKALEPLEGIIYRPQAATFLAWIESNRDDLSLDKHFINAGIMPSEGKYFGQDNNIRLNFGTGTETVIQAMEMLTDYWKRNF
jgi:cystathionine beta-lyase